MAKTWATKCCSGTYKNNYQLCCGIKVEEKMNKSEIGLNAGKVWQLLSDYTRWSYGSLKRKSGLKDKELGAALGWLAREDKIEIHQEEDELYVSLGVNVYIG